MWSLSRDPPPPEPEYLPLLREALGLPLGVRERELVSELPYPSEWREKLSLGEDRASTESLLTRLRRELLEESRGREKATIVRPAGGADMMGKLQTCSILFHLWWYSSKLSETFCMLLLGCVYECE